MNAARRAELGIEATRPLPERQAVGRGTILPVQGLCPLPADGLGGAPRAELLVDGVAHPAWIDPRPLRQDAKERHFFWAWAPFTPVSRPRSVQLELELTFPGGARRAAVLGSMRLDPELSDPLPIEPPTEEPRIVICMATFNPDPGLIERQLRSIADQSVRSWRCIIADDNSEPAAQERIRRLAGTDDRFLVAPRHGGRLGVYGNFERLLSLVPDWAQAVALSDQDDNWYPGKLAALWERLRVGDTTLAYSDMRIVSEAGIALAPTYWTTRRNNYTDLASMLVANTVTGAASLFSAELIADLLPFPPKINGAMHDWWIGTTALALGSVAYIDEPLYDYVQHRGNVLGHLAPPVPRLSAEDVRVLLSASVPRRPEAAEVVERARCDYFDHVQRVVLHAKTLELRCAGRWSSPERHDDALRIARMDSSGRDLAWMLGRGLLRWGRPSVTIARELMLARGIAWRLWAQRPQKPEIGR